METHSLDLNLFQETNADVLNQFLHSCADEICGYPGPSYQQFATNMNWTEGDYKNAYVLFSSIMKIPDTLYLDTTKMPQEYHDLPEHVQSKLMNCLKVRQEQLTAALLRQYSTSIAPTVTDFDYRLKLVMGSSKLASLREPLLELDLALEYKNEKRILSVEMNRDELDTLIKLLETVNS